MSCAIYLNLFDEISATNYGRPGVLDFLYHLRTFTEGHNGAFLLAGEWIRQQGETRETVHVTILDKRWHNVNKGFGILLHNRTG